MGGYRKRGRIAGKLLQRMSQAGGGHGAESVAFCCLSTGVFRFPQQRAAEIATETVKNYINEDSRIKKVIFNVFKDDDLRIYHALIG